MIRPPVFLYRPSAWGLILMLALVPAGYFVQHEIKKNSSESFERSFYPVYVDSKIQSFLNDWIKTSFDYSLANDSARKSICLSCLSPSASQFFQKYFTAQKSTQLNIVAGPGWSFAKRNKQNQTEYNYQIRFLSVDTDYEVASVCLIFVLEQHANEIRIHSIKFANEQDKLSISDFFKKVGSAKHSEYNTVSKIYFKQAADLLFEGKKEEAIVEIDKCLKLEPNFVNALFLRVICNDNFLGSAQREKDLNRLIDLDPSRAFLYALRSSLRIDKKNYAEALADLLMAKDKIKDSDFRINKAYCLSELGKYKEAIVELDTVIKNEPKLSNAYFERGCIKEEHGDALGATIDFSMAKYLSPEVPFFDSKKRKMVAPFVYFSP